MTKEDVPFVFELEKKMIGSADESTILKTLENEKLTYFLLCENDDVVGFIEVFFMPPEAELYDIVVDTKFQGNGYSKLLMDYFISLAKENLVETIFLEVNSNNTKAMNLYTRYGFEKYGVRKNYYGNSDAVLMKLKV